MKRCVLFFIVFVTALLLAVLTDEDPSLLKEGVLVKHNMQTDMDVVGHKIDPTPDFMD